MKNYKTDWKLGRKTAMPSKYSKILLNLASRSRCKNEKAKKVL